MNFTAELTEWLTDIREGTRTQLNFADWLEERGDERCAVMREADGARWEAVWLYMGTRPRRRMVDCILDNWQAIINADNFESLPSAKAEKCLLAEWWGEQEVECDACHGEGVWGRTCCATCNGNGRAKDSRRRAGLRWLVEEDIKCINEIDGVYSVRWGTSDWVMTDTRYEAYYEAASAVGAWLERKKVKVLTK